MCEDRERETHPHTHTFVVAPVSKHRLVETQFGGVYVPLTHRSEMPTPVQIGVCVVGVVVAPRARIMTGGELCCSHLWSQWWCGGVMVSVHSLCNCVGWCSVVVVRTRMSPALCVPHHGIWLQMCVLRVCSSMECGSSPFSSGCAWCPRCAGILESCRTHPQVC